ncbi:MAG: hypothetical protein D8M52_02340 [Chlorobi bacterium]|nr:hypothetical protein [Chlorobiota bacterium]
MKNLSFVLVLALFSALVLDAQETHNHEKTTRNATATPTVEFNDAARISLFGNYDISVSSASFQGIPGVSSCCPEYTSTTGSGLVLGVGYIKPLNTDLTLNLRMHYQSFKTPFTSNETLPIVDLEGGPSQASIEHQLTGTFQQINLEPLMAYRLANNLQALGGVTLGAVFAADFSQKEVLVTPVDGAFANNSRERNVQSGQIPDNSVIAAGISVGLTYNLALNSDRTLFLSPEALFTFSLFPHASNMSWTTHHLRAGLGISYAPPPVDDSLTDSELYEFAKSITPPTSVSPDVPFVSSISHNGFTETGVPTDGSSITLEEFLSTRIRPLLPYVFFKPGSAELPETYRTLSSDQVERFSMKNFYNLDAMITYSHVLNIIGKRMNENPTSAVTLTGCADPLENNASLAAERAQAVADYLTDVWDIAPTRINVITRGLPEKPSRSTDADGLEENARVEISSASPELLAFVESSDTMVVTQPSAIRFEPGIKPNMPIANYTLFIANGQQLLKTFSGPDPLPTAIDWRISESVPWIPKTATQVSYLIAVRDSGGAVIPSATKTIPIRRITSQDKQRSGSPNIKIDRYSLILFGFDQDAVTPDHQEIISLIKQRIQPNSTVKVVGYTDRTGDAAYNKGLSERRARSVATALGVPENNASGRGEVLPLYNNNTPEGRFYSRTVEVLVETPQN